jgi:hypothetical protein
VTPLENEFGTLAEKYEAVLLLCTNTAAWDGKTVVETVPVTDPVEVYREVGKEVVGSV